MRLRVTAEDSSARGTIERGQLELALRRLDDENKARARSNCDFVDLNLIFS